MNSQEGNETNPAIDPLTEKSRVLFDRASEHLDLATGNRLRRMRRAALARKHWHPGRQWLPVGVAAAALLAIGLAWWPAQRGTPVLPANTAPATAADQEPLPDEDTELYAWLGEAPVATEDGKAGAL